MEVLKKSPDENERGWALLEIARALAQAGDYDEALQHAQSIRPGFGQRPTAIAHVVRAASQAGRTPAGLAAIVAATAAPSDQAAVVEGLASAGKAEQALAGALEIKDPNFTVRAHQHVAIAFARLRDYRQARLAAERCDDALFRLEVCTQVLVLHAAEQNPELKNRLAEAGEL